MYNHFILNFLKISLKSKLIQKRKKNSYMYMILDEFNFKLNFEKKILNIYKYIFNIFLTSSFNNNFLSITDYKGRILRRTMPGKWYFKGCERKTLVALKLISEIICYELINDFKIKNINIIKKGIDPYNKYLSLLKLLLKLNLIIFSIKDYTKIAHNGTRSKKKWRLKNKKRRRLLS